MNPNDTTAIREMYARWSWTPSPVLDINALCDALDEARADAAHYRHEYRHAYVMWKDWAGRAERAEAAIARVRKIEPVSVLGTKHWMVLLKDLNAALDGAE